MSNMSYCRFHNTLSDLLDCYDHMEDAEDLSDEERRAMNLLIKVCRLIADDYAEEDQ